MESADDVELTVDDIRAELSDVGRALFDQAVGSARRVKALRAALADAENAGATGDPAGTR